jgi:hypothetical protein
MSSTENVPETVQAKRKIASRTAPRKSLGTRQPGRPHKRLPADVLQTTVLMKKLQVLNAKKTLIAERLEAYDAESKLREHEVKKEDA